MLFSPVVERDYYLNITGGIHVNHIYKNIRATIILDVPSVRKSILDDIINAPDGFDPGLVMDSANWRCWIAVLDLYTCKYCRDTHGKVFAMDEIIYDEPPIHDRCRYTVERLKAIGAGFATRNGKEGADYWLKWHKTIPDYYITKEDAKALGWKAILGNLADVAPDKMIGGDIYQNRNGHLPQAPGRIWYEADINFTDGYRTRHRILYSNDGLIFVTYDHYETFVEIV
jgi:hypothetical protein